MSSNKPRLEVALYLRPKHRDNYHYALFISQKGTESPKGANYLSINTVTKHHVRNTFSSTSGELTRSWRYERRTFDDLLFEQRPPVRIVVAQVKSAEKLERVVERMPVIRPATYMRPYFPVRRG